MTARRLVVLLTLALAVTAASVAWAAKPDGRTAEQHRLLSRVDDDAGAPRSGLDPSRRRQRSLAEAAREPVGTGARTDHPARGVRPAKVRRAPGDVLSNARSTSELSNGCLLGYGKPGAQCLPARAPGNRPLTCDYVLRLFPGGIEVTGKDVRGLDRNRDGRACGKGDL